ncbi:class I SAM-dependent methyltransferase [Nordella sp. HKS 07]|uniref:SAM-dependent methyltransferase n=1 Tax=Nordella sp. HKS 07 TaxID=2712222 RepID=UPI0013E1C16A|nr:class I SAM-dependent methyltransferase [Nordella sp. HKS 07]QIG51554.1 class I SAM-dependent methyltransferase [Nordella sp. HKS 07]
MASRIPERIGWAVATLAARTSDRLLEIGCGRGLAVSLIAPRLKTGSILAIDRSATAIAAARRESKSWQGADKAAFRHMALADLDESEGLFDKMFAINVNLFWTDARAELPVVRKSLKKKGRLYLFYEPPVAAQRDGIAGLVRDKLQASGLTVETVVKKNDSAPLLCLTCAVS